MRVERLKRIERIREELGLHAHTHTHTATLFAQVHNKSNAERTA